MDENDRKLIGARLKERREANNLTLEQVAYKIGKTFPTVAKYESGEIKNIDIMVINTIANLTDTDIDYFLLKSNIPQKVHRNTITNIDNKRAFPILGLVKAGYDYFAQENWIGYVTIDKDVHDIENYFALRVIGDSMQPILYENDLVLVHRQNDVENGQIGIVLIDGEEATVKRVVKHDDYIELIAFNSYYPPRKLTKKDDFKIIGKVVEARINRIFE